MEMMKLIDVKLHNMFNKLLIIFLIAQPIFDFKIFYNSISTLIRVIIIFALFGYYFFTSKNKHKYWLLIYPCLLGVYFVFHHLNALEFTSLVPGNFNYSIVHEFLYFVKMVSPFLLIYCLYKANLSNEKVMDIMKYLCLIIGILIVISNLFKFSYGSYSDITIEANFFEWFNSDSPFVYTDLASKGLFEYANQISAILIMFLPFILYTSLEEHKLFNWFVLGINIFSLILLCTKVSVLGILVVLFYSMFTFGFISFINKKYFEIKKYIPVGVVLLVYCLLLPVNPMFSRIQERATVVDNYNTQLENEFVEQNTDISDDTENIESTEEIQNQETSNSEVNEMLEYIENNYKDKKIHEQFLLHNYPYEYDPEFWYNFIQNDIWLTTDYRFTEISMIQRVVEINNNPMDKWLGITNTRLQNVFNIERDFVVQYYALGIIGTTLVLAPYFVLLGIFAYRTTREKLKNLNEINLLAGITIVFLFGISYFSGNLLNSLSFTIYFTLCFRLITSLYSNK